MRFLAVCLGAILSTACTTAAVQRAEIPDADAQGQKPAVPLHAMPVKYIASAEPFGQKGKGKPVEMLLERPPQDAVIEAGTDTSAGFFGPRRVPPGQGRILNGA